jgi:beta-lactamase superfamily II metal-dependent hydrolase
VIDPSLPDRDEVEVSVFGGGYGEALCVHVDGDWFLVDSCVNPETDAPAGLSYLETLGVDPAAVRLIVVTHWDDDHIKGVAQLVAECGSAAVACSLALRREDIIQFVYEQDSVAGSLGSGLDELRSVLDQCRSNGRLIWAKAALPLYPKSPGAAATVTALSPSDESVSRSIESLIEQAAEAPISYPRRYRAPDKPNAASVATSVRDGPITLLLGADLERSNNDLAGWSAVVDYAKPVKKASMVKVPHHGSEGAYSERMWDEMVERPSTAVLTPWTLGGRHLPSEDDLARLRDVADEVYVTSVPAVVRARKDPAVEKVIRRVANVRLETIRGWGQVRARRRPDEQGWRIDLAGDAMRV